MNKKKTLHVTDRQAMLLETLLHITMENFTWSQQHGDYRSVNPGAFMSLSKGDRTSMQSLQGAVIGLNREGKSFSQLLKDDMYLDDYIEAQIAAIEQEPF